MAPRPGYAAILRLIPPASPAVPPPETGVTLFYDAAGKTNITGLPAQLAAPHLKDYMLFTVNAYNRYQYSAKHCIHAGILPDNSFRPGLELIHDLPPHCKKKRMPFRHPPLYFIYCRLYFTTILMIFLGTTINLTIVLPSVKSLTRGIDNTFSLNSS